MSGIRHVLSVERTAMGEGKLYFILRKTSGVRAPLVTTKSTRAPRPDLRDINISGCKYEH